MRPFIPLPLAMALVAAGCTGSPAATPAPSPTSALVSPVAGAPTPSSTPTEVVRPSSEAPAPTPTAVSARITFDGERCNYTGPTVIPFPASLTVEYAPVDAEKNSWLGVTAVRSGTTQAEVSDPGNPPVGVEETPDFVYEDSHMLARGPGVSEYRAVFSGSNPMADLAPAPIGRPFDTYIVFCVPELPGLTVGGTTFLHVVVPGASPLSSPEP